jgi:hypothetical protein
MPITIVSRAMAAIRQKVKGQAVSAGDGGIGDGAGGGR